MIAGVVVNQKTYNHLKILPEKQMPETENFLGVIPWGTPIYVKKWQRGVKVFYDRKLLEDYLLRID